MRPDDRCPACGSDWVSSAYHDGPGMCAKSIELAHICQGCARCGHSWSKRAGVVRS